MLRRTGVGCGIGDVCIFDTVGMTHQTTIMTRGLWVVQLRRAAPLNSSSANTVPLLCMNHPLAPVQGKLLHALGI